MDAAPIQPFPIPNIDGDRHVQAPIGPEHARPIRRLGTLLSSAMVRDVIYTLIDEIAFAQKHAPKLRNEDFQNWELVVSSAAALC